MSLDKQQPSLGTSSHPYDASLSSSASSSTSSVFSVDVGSSQTTNSSVSSSQIGWESDDWSSRATVAGDDVNGVNTFAPIARVNTYPQCRLTACLKSTAEHVLPPLRSDLSLPVDQRQHPRRSSTASARPPPALVRQCERKINFVDGLVDSATQMVECIWPLSVPSSRCEVASGRGVLPLRTFIQETLRRSRTSYSTLQVALYYLILIKSHVPKHDFTMPQPEDTPSCRALQCGRRMFLAALVLASKYLQDRNYSARAWAKISGLKVCEINANEMAFLVAVNWKLHITDLTWERWQKVVLDNTPSHQPPSPGAGSSSVDMRLNSWRYIIPRLTPELEIVQFAPKTPFVRAEAQQEFRSNMEMRSPTWPEGYSSQETTPTPSHYKLPRYLEPKPDMLPPTPTLRRMAPLPTPNLTPQSIASSTPAASALAFGSTRPSMCAAMAQAQGASLARTCLDQWSVRSGLEAYQLSGRRPSVAPSTASSSSSPESMVMDNASRSSRASSISSVSSAGWAPTQSKLARLATCRSARLPYPAMRKTGEIMDYVPMEPMSSPDLDTFHIEDVEIKQFDSPSSMRSTPEKKLGGRKRGRSSVELHQNVGQLLKASHSVSLLRVFPDRVLPDRSAAVSFLLPEPGERTPLNGPMGLQTPASMSPEHRLPIQKDFGRKRTCCATEATETNQRTGPGMWEGVL